MTRDNLASVAGGMAKRHIFEKVPSKFIPFRGKFPILYSFQNEDFVQAVCNTHAVSDLPKRYRNAVKKGYRIAIYEESFKEYLKEKRGYKNCNDFLLETKEKKGQILFDWKATNCIDSLTI